MSEVLREEHRKIETVLSFRYPAELKADALKVKEVLESNGIMFAFYESPGYYPHEFFVRRSGKKWDDIMRLVNSVKAAKYTKVKREVLEA